MSVDDVDVAIADRGSLPRISTNCDFLSPEVLITVTGLIMRETTTNTSIQKLVEVLRHHPTDRPLSRLEQEELVLLKRGWFPVTIIGSLYADPIFSSRLANLLDSAQPDRTGTELPDISQLLKVNPAPQTDEKSQSNAFNELIADLSQSTEVIDLSTIVRRQGPYEQQIVELVANGFDSMLPENKTGTFGIGGLSALPRQSGERFQITSATGLAVEIQNHKGRYYFRYLKNQDASLPVLGTIAEVVINDFSDKKAAFIEELRRRFSFSHHQVLVRDGAKEESIGRADHNKHSATVIVEITKVGYRVVDAGKGFPESTFLQTFIVPTNSESRTSKVKTTKWETERVPITANEKPRLVLQSGNLTIVSAPLTENHSNHVIIYLPDSAKFDISRKVVLINADLLRSLTKAVETTQSQEQLIDLAIQGSYFYQRLTTHSNEATALNDLFAKIAEMLTRTGEKLRPDYAGTEYMCSTASKDTVSTSILVPYEVFAQHDRGVSWSRNNQFEWHSSYRLRLTQLQQKVVVIMDETIYVDQDVFFQLLSRGNQGLALFNLLVNKVDTSYRSAAILQGLRPEIIGELAYKRSVEETNQKQAQTPKQINPNSLERKIESTESHWLNSEILDEQLEHVFSGFSLRDRKLIENDERFRTTLKKSLPQYFDLFFVIPGKIKLLEDSGVLKEVIEVLLPKNAARPEGWNFCIDGLLKNPRLVELVRDNQISLNMIVDRILSPDESSSSYQVTGFLQDLFDNPGFVEILKISNTFFSDLYEKLFSLNQKPFEFADVVFLKLFRSPRLGDIFKYASIPLDKIINRMLISLEEGDNIPFTTVLQALLEHPDLARLLAEQNIKLNSLVDRILLPQDFLQGDNIPFTTVLQALLEHPDLARLLAEQNIKLNSLVDRILLPQDFLQGEHILLGLLSNKQLATIVRDQSFSLHGLLEKMYPGGINSGISDSSSIVFLLENPQLAELVKTKYIDLEKLFEYSFPKVWTASDSKCDNLLYFVNNPSAAEALTASQISLDPYVLRLIENGSLPDGIWQFSYHSNLLSIWTLSLMFRTAPFIDGEARRMLPLPVSINIKPPLSEHLQWRVWQQQKASQSSNLAPATTLMELYQSFFDSQNKDSSHNSEGVCSRVFEKLKNELQRVYALEILSYFHERKQLISTDSVISFVKEQTDFAEKVVIDLISCNRSELTHSILDILDTISLQQVKPLFEVTSSNQITISLSDLFRYKAQLEGKENSKVKKVLAWLATQYEPRKRDELQTHLTGQTPRHDTGVRELLQNASDECKLTGQTAIQIRIGLDDHGRATLEVADDGRGMTLEDIFTKLLVPFRPDYQKRANSATEGGIGWGLFTIFPMADEVSLITIKDGQQTCLRLQVARDDQAEILDVITVAMEQKITTDQNGTKIQVHLPQSKLPHLDLISLYAAVQLYARPLTRLQIPSGDFIALTVNDEPLTQQELRELGTESTEWGDLTVAVTHRHQDPFARIQKRKLFLGDPNYDMDLLGIIPQSVKDFYHQHGLLLQIELPVRLEAVLSRAGVAINERTQQRLQQGILKIMLQDIARRVITGDGTLSFIPDDFLTKDPKFYGQYDSHKMIHLAEKLNNDEMLGADECVSLADPQALLQVVNNILFTLRPEDSNLKVDAFISSLNLEESYTIAQLRTMIAGADVESQSLLVAERKRLWRQIQKTESAVLLGNMFLDTSQSPHLSQLSDWMNTMAKKLLPNLTLSIKIADPVTVGSTVWVNDTLGMPVSASILDEIDRQKSDWELSAPGTLTTIYNLFIHELTHYVEYLVIKGKVESLQPLLQLLTNSNEYIDADFARKIIAFQSPRPWTHTSTEEAGFGKIYKGLMNLLTRKLLETNVQS